MTRGVSRGAVTQAHPCEHTVPYTNTSKQEPFIWSAFGRDPNPAAILHRPYRGSPGGREEAGIPVWCHAHGRCRGSGPGAAPAPRQLPPRPAAAGRAAPSGRAAVRGADAAAARFAAGSALPAGNRGRQRAAQRCPDLLPCLLDLSFFFFFFFRLYASC